MISLQDLIENAQKCTNCDLHKGRTNCVFHRGNINPDIAFVGEAPGENEDKTGVPFCGRSGKLLDNMIRAMGYIDLSHVYICNICKCRPPNNRKPTADEMDKCKILLDQQLVIVNPKIIIALGSTATEGLLGPGPGIMKRRGIWGEYKGIKVMPTFHPSFCLRQPKMKELVWEDLHKVLKLLSKLPENQCNN